MTTAIQRNITLTPKRISFAFFVTDYLLYWVMVPWHINLFLMFLGSVIWGIGGLVVMDMLADWLSWKRLESWASEMRGVHPDDLEDWLNNTEAEELDQMIAMDFEGWAEEDEE